MILVVDDDKAIRLSLKLILERNEYAVTLAENPKAAIDIVRSHPELELVLMDMNYDNSTTGDEGLTLLKQVKVFRPEIPCILMTAWGTIDLAVQGMRAGAFDFITKPWDNGVLLDRIETAIKLSPLSRSTLGRFDTSQNSPRGEVDFISSQKPQNRKLALSPTGGAGRGAVLPSLASVYATIARIAPTNASVLITGESGTGKELIAEAIHRQSHRAGGPFVKVNLGGISQTLFESEMFGHKKGAFTDAKEDRVGRFELASHTRRTDVRVICATNADLPSMVEEHTFREDLFYRINLISIHLPPLRQRRQDIPLLVDFFLHQSSLSPAITPDAISYLQSLPFPGNIRELKNLVERTVLMAEGEELTAADFRQSLSPSSHESVCPSVLTTGSSPTLEELERAAIAASIQKHAGNLSLVAKELGISRGALYRKIEKHGL